MNARRKNVASLAAGDGSRCKRFSLAITNASMKFRVSDCAIASAETSLSKGTVTVAMAILLRYQAVTAPSP